MKAAAPGTSPVAHVCLICIFVYMNTDGARQDGRHARQAGVLFRAVVLTVPQCAVHHKDAAAGKYCLEGGMPGAWRGGSQARP